MVPSGIAEKSAGRQSPYQRCYDVRNCMVQLCWSLEKKMRVSLWNIKIYLLNIITFIRLWNSKYYKVKHHVSHFVISFVYFIPWSYQNCSFQKGVALFVLFVFPEDLGPSREIWFQRNRLHSYSFCMKQTQTYTSGGTRRKPRTFVRSTVN